MSTATVDVQTNNQLFVKYDLSKLFIGSNRYRTVSFTNATGGDLDLAAGRLMAYDPATQEAVLFDSAGAAPANVPFGILGDNYEAIPDTATINVCICVEGDVCEEMVEPEAMRPYFYGCNYAVRLVPSVELTKYDN